MIVIREEMLIRLIEMICEKKDNGNTHRFDSHGAMLLHELASSA